MGSLAAKPCALRLVTCVVLMLSDIDVFFSMLFLKSLAEADGLFLYFFGITVFGILTYLLGILLIGPGQKYKVLEMVSSLMRSNPEEFCSSSWKRTSDGMMVGKGDPRFQEEGNTACKVQMGTELSPEEAKNPPARKKIQTFQDMEKLFTEDYFAFLPFCGSGRKEAIDKFQQAIHDWGLSPIWDACEIKNALNCVEIKHGMPGLRLACFGFQSEPSPKDLAGILNANALYSATTGIVQIAFGGVLISEYGVSTEVLIPLTISGLSIVLSGFNVLLDFAGKLAKVENEQRMSDKIRRVNKTALTDKSAALKVDRDAKLDAIDKRYQAMPPANIAAAQEQKTKEKQCIKDSFAQDYQALNDGSAEELELELTEYREALVRERELLCGKSLVKRNAVSGESDFVVARRRGQQIATLRSQIEALAEEKMSKLKIDDPDFAAKAQTILKERYEKGAVVAEMERVNVEGIDIEMGNGGANAERDEMHGKKRDAGPRRCKSREMHGKDVLPEHWNEGCSFKKAQKIRKAINIRESSTLWNLRRIGQPERFVFQSLAAVDANQVKRLMDKISEAGFSGFINGGTHGSKDGCHAADPAPCGTVTYGDVSFAKEDYNSGNKSGHWGLHIVSKGCPPQYPKANFIVNAWCFSDGKGRVQPGAGLPPMRIQSKLPSKIFLKILGKDQLLAVSKGENTKDEEWNLAESRLVPRNHPGFCLTVNVDPLSGSKPRLEAQLPEDSPDAERQRWTIDRNGRIISQFYGQYCVAADKDACAIPKSAGRGDFDDSDDSETGSGDDTTEDDASFEAGDADARAVKKISGSVLLKKISKDAGKAEQCWSVHYC